MLPRNEYGAAGAFYGFSVVYTVSGYWQNLMATRNVVLTDRQAKFVEKMVSSGRYQNASEVMREGLRLIEQQEAEKEAKLKALRAAVQLGIEDIETGRAITFDSFEALEDHLRKTTAAALKRNPK